MSGRFAPSPTGRMHLGNVASALMSWLAARSAGDKWILRIEDLDAQRSRREHAMMIEDDLHWLGLDWDEGGVDDVGPAGPYSQSRRSAIYDTYLRRLMDIGLTYPCRCTRAEILATQAPHQADGRVVYGGRCRPAHLPCAVADYTGAAVRIFVPDREIVYVDGLYGRQSYNLANDVGDFVLRRADGAWAYQLAVVVDDALMGVRQVVRGSDLLLSAAQQIYLYELLGFDAPSYMHIPLLCNARGQRLSKRDGSLAMGELRGKYSARQILGHIAHLYGLLPQYQPTTATELATIFDASLISRTLAINIGDSF